MACEICNHPNRRAIEDYILVVDTPGVAITLSETAKRFEVPLVDLQVHALMHTPLARLEDESLAPTIASQMKRGEANLLYAVAEEYHQTLRQTGREIRRRLGPMFPSEAPAALEFEAPPRLTKELVDLYIGTGNNLRQTVGTIVEMNQKLNDESDPALVALHGIIQAVRGPAPSAVDEEDDD